MGRRQARRPAAARYLDIAQVPARAAVFGGNQLLGTLRSSSASHALALPSDGARQSPLGDNDPPELTLGPFGIAERLNWLNAKKRRRKTSSHLRIAGKSYALRRSCG